jgi:hypothetical protein
MPNSQPKSILEPGKTLSYAQFVTYISFTLLTNCLQYNMAVIQFTL